MSGGPPSAGTTRHVLLLDLKDDPQAVAAYEQYHRAVWPDVLAHLQRHGVLEMTIHRLGTRLVMVMTTDDRRFDAARMEAAANADPVMVHWETLMSDFQTPTPWSVAGRKWTVADPIFRFVADPAA